MNSKVEVLSQVVTPNCSGIIWLTKNALSYSTSATYEFNYLLNGLLTKSISKNDSSQSFGHIFMSQNFGRPFFICHNLTSENSPDSLHKQLGVLKSSISKGNKVLIFTDDKGFNISTTQKELSKKYPEFKFEVLNLDHHDDIK